MSEKLMQVVPAKVGRFLYYPTRASTLQQLKAAKIIPGSAGGALTTKRPDGLIVVPQGKVVAVIEYKQTSELKTQAKIAKAIKQELEVAKALKSNVLIVTDNTKSFWVNAHTGNRISDSSGRLLNAIVDVRKFQDGSLSPEAAKNLESLLDSISASVSENNDSLMAVELLDPTPLAKALWQRIWVSTGKEAEKCLYNVVELFVFKFLSDLGVLQQHLNFDAVMSACTTDGPEDALKLYAGTSRKQIRELFPPGKDGTTVINGTIFVTEEGEPNLAQAVLFGTVLKLLDDFGKKVGSFRKIHREFKTRLYEAFLRQSAGTKALGQYFTPRNVVQAMVRMSDAKSLPKDAVIGDPFCGVGGFVLETVAEVDSIYKQFEPKNGKIEPSVTLLGFDKGSDEKEDERTIILAKANMLIYFSDLIAKHHSRPVLREFSEKAFNRVFHLLRSNLGTFAKKMERPFDLILTNPPYVTNGVSSLRSEIELAEDVRGYYTFKGRGTESLAIEWIVRNLAEKGQALVVVPDGLLTQTEVLRSISELCEVQAIISLPPKTFYSTPKKTYILILKKKEVIDNIDSVGVVQTAPVFAYLVSEIGETRDFYRFSIEQNDFVEAVELFRQFKGSPCSFKSSSSRFKPYPAASLLSDKNWLVEKLWSDDERRDLGVTDTSPEVSPVEFIELAKFAGASVERLVGLVPETQTPPESQAELSMGGSGNPSEKWMEYVTTKTGWTKTQYRKLAYGEMDACPVYSAAKSAVAMVAPSNPGKIEATPEEPIISFAANGDGSAGTNFVFHTSPFYVSNDRTCIRITDKDIDPEYVMYALHGMKETYGFNHAHKAVKENLGVVRILVPITQAGAFDRDRQVALAQNFKKISEAKAALEEQLANLLKNRLVFG